MLSSQAYTEAFYIVNLMSEEMRSKIPEKILNNIKNRMDDEYEFFIDEENIETIQLLEDTEKILSVLYTDYLSTEEEREIILNKEKIISESKILNQIKNNDIKIKEIFPEGNKQVITNKKNENNSELLIIKQEKWYTKIFNFIKRIFE